MRSSPLQCTISSCDVVKCGEVGVVGLELPGKHWRKRAGTGPRERLGNSHWQRSARLCGRPVDGSASVREHRPSATSKNDKIVGKAMSGGIGSSSELITWGSTGQEPVVALAWSSENTFPHRSSFNHLPSTSSSPNSSPNNDQYHHHGCHRSLFRCRPRGRPQHDHRWYVSNLIPTACTRRLCIKAIN